MALCLLATACSKDDDDSATPEPTGGGSTNNNAASTTPLVNGADGALFAVSTATTYEVPFVGPIAIDLNTGVGVFYDDAGAKVNAGTVRCNDSLFTFQNGAYYFQQSIGNITGLDFGPGVNWNVTGGSGIPAFTRSITSIPMPSVGDVNSATTINRATDYTLSVPFVSGADSVYYTVGGLLKRTGGGATSCVFTAAELGTLNAGTNIVQVAAFTYYGENIGGKDIYFGKERVITKSVTLQ